MIYLILAAGLCLFLLAVFSLIEAVNGIDWK